MAQRYLVGGSRFRWLLSRGIAALGGTAATTAAAWALASGSAAAEPVLVNGIEQDVTQFATTVINEASGYAERMPEAQVDETLAALTAASAESLRANLTRQQQEPCTDSIVDCASAFVDNVDHVGATTHSAVSRSADINTHPYHPSNSEAELYSRSPRSDEEVAAATARESLGPVAHSPAPQLRTTSGMNQPTDGTGDASPHTPAPVPVTAPTAAAGGAAVPGSSLFPQVIGHASNADVRHGAVRVVAVPVDAGRPTIAGSQPGTAPD